MNHECEMQYAAPRLKLNLKRTMTWFLPAVAILLRVHLAFQQPLEALQYSALMSVYNSTGLNASAFLAFFIFSLLPRMLARGLSTIRKQCGMRRQRIGLFKWHCCPPVGGYDDLWWGSLTICFFRHLNDQQLNGSISSDIGRLSSLTELYAQRIAQVCGCV